MRRFVMLMAVLLALPALRGEAGAQEFKVIVHASVPVDQVSADELSRVFQKKAADLGGARVVPVDQGSGSAVREAFSQAVHGRSASAIESFWQQQIFSGKDVPPEQKGNDGEVLSFVGSTPGAVGYVSAGASVPGGVKVIQVAF